MLHSTYSPRPHTGQAGRPGPGRSVQGERRMVTILFCDIKGSTAMAERLDPEEWAEIMNQAFDHLITPVYRYEGTVARLQGDGLLAFFGAPLAHEDDAHRGVLAGLQIVRNIESFRPQIAQEYGMDFNVRVGINTGIVVVGEIGSELAGEYTAMGDAVNVAARMEESAQPGTLQIAEATYRLIEGAFECEPLGEIEIKGKSERVATYRVLRRKSVPIRSRGLPGHVSTFVGRGQEFSALRRAVIKTVQGGQGQVVFVVGDAGLGKSRLVEEVRLATTKSPETPLLWLISRGVSYDAHRPYGLFRQYIRQLYNVLDTDTPEVVIAKLMAQLDDLPPHQHAPIEQGLYSLLRHDDNPPATLPVDGETFRRAIRDAARFLLERLLKTTPVALFLDDLHWADPASIDLLQSLLPLIETHPLLLLWSMRPELNNPQADAARALRDYARQNYAEHYTEIDLTPLREQDTLALVDNLLLTAGLLADARELILRKSEGNPLFVEEVARMLMENAGNGPADDSAIPDSLHALLTARIDRLQAEHRRTLQLASVIGRVFPVRLLRELAEITDDTGETVSEALAVLEDAQMVRVAAEVPEQEYTFVHELVREAAYNSILHRARRQVHRRVAELIESLYPERADMEAHLVARHYFEARDYARALPYAVRAGEIAQKLYAQAEAIESFTIAIEAANRLAAGSDGAESAVSLFALYRRRAQSYEIVGEFDEARQDGETVLRMAQSSGNRAEELQALLDLGALWASRSYALTGAYYQQALDLAREHDDPAMLALSLNRVGNWHANVDRPHESIRHHEEALAILRGLNDKRGIAQTLDLLGQSSQLACDIVKSVDYYRQAIALFRELDDRMGLVSSLSILNILMGTYYAHIIGSATALPPFEHDIEQAARLANEIGWRSAEAFALNSQAIYYGPRGDYDRAIGAARRALKIAQEIEHKQWTTAIYWALGMVCLDVMAYDLAEEHALLAWRMADELGSAIWRGLTASILTQVYVRQGKSEAALEVINVVLGPDTPAVTQAQRTAWHARAEVALAQNEPALALEIAIKVIDSSPNEISGSVRAILRHWAMKARALARLGRVEEAEKTFLAVMDAANADGLIAFVWRLRVEMGRLYRSAGREADATREFAAAREIVDELVQKIPDDAICATFASSATALLDSASQGPPYPTHP